MDLQTYVLTCYLFLQTLRPFRLYVYRHPLENSIIMVTTKGRPLVVGLFIWFLLPFLNVFSPQLPQPLEATMAISFSLVHSFKSTLEDRISQVTELFPNYSHKLHRYKKFISLTPLEKQTFLPLISPCHPNNR